MKIRYIHILTFAFYSVLEISCNPPQHVIQEHTPSEFRSSWENGYEIYPYFHVVRNDQSIDSLPANVPRPIEKKLSLYADYSKIWRDYVLLYLINTSNDSIKFTTEGGDIYIKLEARDSIKHKWVRAQHHAYSWCGNSYGTITLHPGKFLAYRGMFPTNGDGDSTQIRYRIYDSEDTAVVSNVSFARVSQEMINEAKFDLMSIRYGDSVFITQIALGKILTPTENKFFYSPQYVRFKAIEELVRFPSEGTLRNLEQIAEDGSLSDYFRRASVSALQRLKNGIGKSILLKLLANTSMSDELYKETFDALNQTSKADALKLVQSVCLNKQFHHRHAVFQVLSNAFRLENEGEKIENLYRTWWQQDSVKFKKSYGTTVDEAIYRERTLSPLHYKFYLLDSTLFRSISSIKTDFSDPAILDIMICYAEYRTPDRADYLNSVYKNSSISDSLKKRLHSLISKE